MITGLHHIAIICSERARSVAFYQALGFEIERCHIRPEHHDELIMMAGHGITLELFIDATHPPHVTNPEAYGLRHLALKVTQIEQTISALKERLPDSFCPEPIRCDSFTGEKMTFVKDPDGLPIELHE